MKNRRSLPAILPCFLLAACLLVPAYSYAEGPCSNEQLRRESLEDPATHEPYSTQLPDCRAYELVSPPDTEGWAVPPEHRATNIITAGGSVLFESQATPEGTGAFERGHFLDVFRSSRAGSGWATQDMTAFGSAFESPAFIFGASPDASSILIGTYASLSPADLDNPENSGDTGFDLYMVRREGPPELITRGELPDLHEFASGPNATITHTNGDLSAVGFQVDPGVGLSEDDNLAGNCYIWTDAGSHLAQLTNSDYEPGKPNCKYDAVTADGRPVVEDTSGDSHTGLIFAVGDRLSSVGTRQLSGDTPKAAAYDALSPDGATAYITTTDQLDPLHDVNSTADLYAVNVDEGATAGIGGPPNPAGVRCVSCGHDGGFVKFVGQSADGSHVFYESAEGLWGWDRQSGEATRLTEAVGVSQLAISENGQYVVGVTSQALSPEDSNGGPDIYEFAAGAPPKLVTDGTSNQGYLSPAVSNDGQSVVYGDNPAGGGASVIDEWVAGDTGQISPLAASASYELMGTAGPDLENVFFVAHEPLVTQDLNAGTPDIYDARIDGGFPASTPPASESKTENPVGTPISPYTANLVSPSEQLGPLPPDTSRPAGATKPRHAPKKTGKKRRSGKRARHHVRSRKSYSAHRRGGGGR